MLSEAIYKRAFRVTSLFTNAMLTQIQIGCDAEKCRVIENGIDIPLEIAEEIVRLSENQRDSLKKKFEKL